MKIARKKGYHHGDLREALLTAAERLIATKGTAHVTMREAARLAGVSVAAPYRHFADLEAILAAVAARGFDELRRSMVEQRSGARGPEQQLMAVGRGYLLFAVARAQLYRLMFGSALDKANHPELLAAARAAHGELLSAVRACSDAGLLASGDVTEHALAGWALCHGFASLYEDGVLVRLHPGDVHRLGARLIRRLLDGVLRHR